MTIKFEGVTPDQLVAIHKIVDGAKTVQRYPEGCRVRQVRYEKLEDNVPFMKVTKSAFMNGSYTLYIQVLTKVFATTTWSDGRVGRSQVLTSRSPLIEIFDVLGIMPEEETVYQECR